MDNEAVIRYEPLPRWGHVSITLGNKVYMWGGRTEDFSETQKERLATSVEVFDCKTETWVTRNTSGTHPQGLYNSAYALQGINLYVYGGWDGVKAHNALYRLNLQTFAWTEVKVENPDEAPPEMSGCGIVAYGSKRLVLFGGYGIMKKKVKFDEKESEVSGTSEEGEVGEREDREEAGKVENGVKDRNGDTEHGSQEARANGVDEGNGMVESETTENGTAKKGEGEGGERGKKGEGGEEERGEEERGEEREGAGKNEETVESNGETHEKISETDGSKAGVGNGVSGEESEKDTLPKKVSFEIMEEITAALETREAAVEKTQNTTEEKQKQDDKKNGVEGVPKLEEGESVGGGDTEGASEEESNASFSFYKRNDSDQKGWTNEVKVFDLDTGMWTSQSTTGCVPPPCVDFSFTCVDQNRAVVFGGYQPQTGITNDTFLLDMDTWVWTKLSSPSETSSPSQPTPSLLLHPSARDGHAACVIEGGSRPLMLVTGGWDAMDHALNDMWVLDVKSGLWSQLTGGEGVGCRFWHTMVASPFSSRMRQLLTFGGCPGAPESHATGSWPKIADTFIVEMGKIPRLPTHFTGDSKTEENNWVVIDTLSMDQLGDPMHRLRETVLLTRFCAQRAEELIQEMTKKIEGKVSTPKPKAQSSLIQEVVTEQVEEKRPFWQKSINEIQMTYQEIGRGRFSVVKVAIYHETRVAARCLFNNIVSEENRKVFAECLEMAAQLRHPNLVSFMGAILDREPVIITELMPCNLRSVLEKSPLTYYQLVDVAMGVAKALEYLHTIKPEPVIHGELTGTNVLLEGSSGPRLRPKLSDYMTAKYFHHLMSTITPTSSIEDVFSPSREHPSQEYKPRRRSRSGSPFDLKKPRISPDRSTRLSAQISRKMSTTISLDVGIFSTQRDVYLFAILLVEMATRTAVLEVSLQYLIESIAWPQVTALVKKCLAHEPDQRPAMNSVLSEVMQLASFKP